MNARYLSQFLGVFLSQKLLARLSGAEVASLPGSLRRIHSAWLGPSVQMLKCKVKHRGIFREGVNTTSTFRTLEKVVLKTCQSSLG